MPKYAFAQPVLFESPILDPHTIVGLALVLMTARIRYMVGAATTVENVICVMLRHEEMAGLTS